MENIHLYTNVSITYIAVVQRTQCACKALIRNYREHENILEYNK